MEINYSQPNQTARFIAVGRVVMVAVSLFAIRLDPLESASKTLIVESILLWYIIYAIVLAVSLWYLVNNWIHLDLVIHSIDIAVTVLLIFFTAGPASPFFVYFIFSMVCATLCWRWRGTLYTALTVTGIMLFMSLYPKNLLNDPAFPLDRFIIRMGYLPVVAGLLAYLSAYEHQRSQVAASEERLNLCRDLHDGLLQSLAGAALQLEAARQSLEKDPVSVQQRIVDIQKLIFDEQQELRAHIRSLKSSSVALPESKENLISRLKELALRIERQWGPRVHLELKLPQERLPGTLSHGAYMIVHEALINAARHAKASSIHAAITGEPNALHIAVTDNGCGFSFRGCYDLHALTRMNVGPVTLRERVAFLGGSLTIESADTGTSIEIDLPIIEKRG